MRRLVLFALAAFAPGALVAQGSAPRRIAIEDLHRFRDVSDPQLSPEGNWVAYTVSVADLGEDGTASDLWMTSWDGRTTLRLTTTASESEHTPRWSPDGRYLAFLSGRGNDDGVDQLWLLPRAGGEAEQVTHHRTGVADFSWSPAGDRLALVIEDGDSVEVHAVFPPRLEDAGAGPEMADEGPQAPRDSASRTTAPPIVIDR